MGDADADRIQRDRERRRTAERLRIEDERRERREELTRLRRIEQSRGPGASTEPRPPRLLVVPGEAAGVPSPEGARARAAEPTDRRRAIGGTIRSNDLEEFLATDPSQRFDIQTLNTLHLTGLVSGAIGDSKLVSAIGHQAEMLMARVKHEVDDPLSAGAFLREQILRWCRQSANDIDWGVRMPERWAGIFSDSRTAGGRSQPWLNTRLWALREEASRARPLRGALQRSVFRDRSAKAAAMRTPSEQLHAEVAQAILDDLATHVFAPGVPRPLVRLSELAVRRQVPTVNDTLALLFNAPESGPFVVLHPNRYPEFDELQIRPPTPGATGAALAYSLAPGRPPRKSAPLTRDASALLGPSPASVVAGAVEEDIDATTVWDAETIAPAAWMRIVEERQRERRRLDSPPKDCRTRPAYAPLRDLVLSQDDFRKAFLAAKWRGRPSGLPLLALLLQKGSLAPEVATDHEYLEAELEDLVRDDATRRPEEGIWTFGSWTVTREGSHRDGFRFRADRGR
jgi:hypothetical protein